ncbi:hypothetical protein GY45DRAFT_306718 [Cubamyces sp. BRFM 1775]|nr:hypothetical protein GY45DRAFT_306718 [Cubamyces sp. BRFM 1775]
MHHDTSTDATGLPGQHGTRSGVYGGFYEARVRPLSRTLHAPPVSSLPQRSGRSPPQPPKSRPSSSSVVSYADASGVSDSGGESDYQPVPRKRKHASTNPSIGATFPPRKRAKTQNAAPYVRSRSVRSRQGREAVTLSLMETKLSDYQDEDAVNNSDENNKCLLVHSIDWNDPPTWGGDVIPRMPATAILPYLKDRYDLHGSVTCLWNGCGQQMNVAMSLKNHLHCDSHINLRRKCPRCSWSVRPDMWNSRYPNHLCGESFAWRK